MKAVDDVSFTVGRGEVLGLVGESGSGKSMTGYSLMGLIDPPGRIVAGNIVLDGVDLRALSPEGMRHMRGNRIAMIFQDPMMTLNPVLRIDVQMIEAILAHDDVSHAAARARARETLVKVGIPSPDERLEAYPHQFSGGMRQRVAIAIALLNSPDLIIADEPTTALDVTIQGQILYEMQKLTRETGTALIWITHDLSVVAGLADRVCVMYAGRIVEQGTTRRSARTTGASVHAGLARLGACEQRARTAPAADPGNDAVAARPAARVPVSRALRLRERSVSRIAADAPRRRRDADRALLPSARSVSVLMAHAASQSHPELRSSSCAACRSAS